MNKMLKKILSLVLCLCLAGGTVLYAQAAEPEETVPEEIVMESLSIHSVEDFLEFAENCRLDTYSRDLAVTLEADLDLIGVEFAGIPTFGGVFDGKGHTVSGLNIVQEGSVMGLFRYVQSGAVVMNLNVTGQVMPDGSCATVGGIVGHNAGMIRSCAFDGQVTGSDEVGGITGHNALTGIVEGCAMEGAVVGNHFVGGIAGENLGVIRYCSNRAKVNTTAAENSVELSDITMDTLTGSESVSTVTDIGGIAGESSGVIRSCVNRGNVGYRHMGYNIGGIVGTQSGYVVDCANYGEVHGRKEVGGITGQMEPVTNVIYSEDTLQILQEQADSLQALTNRASANAQGNASKISKEVGKLQEQTETMRESVDILIPDPENPEIPDQDSIQAAQNNLTDSLSGISTSLNGLSSTVQGTMGTLAKDLQAISNMVGTMSATISGASETLGGSLTDVSDQDTAELLTGKVERCANYGDVLADMNAGGIAGAMALENDMDIASDLEIDGELSLNFVAEVRAVVLNCDNYGNIVAKKQNGGGIAGGQMLGLIKDCRNTGHLTAEAADYVGGIAGLSSGFIRSCSVKCSITADDYAGGIAGMGDVVSDCRVMVELHGSEKTGALLGSAEELPGQGEEQKITNNFYLPVEKDAGALDGISYDGYAQPLTAEDFYALENLEKILQTVTLRFTFDDGSQEVVSLSPGQALTAEQIPAVPEKAGYIGAWDGLQDRNPERILFDDTFHLTYTKKLGVIASVQRDEQDRPLLLAEGSFAEGDELTALALEAPALKEGETVAVSCRFQLSGGEVDKLRCLYGEDSGNLRLMLLDDQGVWYPGEFLQDESYLVFSVRENIHGFCFVKEAPDYTYVIAGAAAVAVALAALLLIKRRKKQ